ncbi:hypothetical protein HDU67_000145 [Dinochytrium kinnereticum]|nr:hypothetical protein HDU67_000145 [Dinochytrium kinnereticum]
MVGTTLLPAAMLLAVMPSFVAAADAASEGSHGEDSLCVHDLGNYQRFWSKSDFDGAGFRQLETHQIMWIVCLVCTAATVVLSGINMTKHLKHFTKPSEQVPIMRIIMFAPVYAVISFLAFQFYPKAVYIFTVRDCYEAFAIYSFFTLLMQYVGKTHQEQIAYLATKHEHHYPGPCRCFGKFDPASPRFFKRTRMMVLQYVIVKPLLTIMAVALESKHKFCEASMSPKYGHFWYVAIGLTSILTCVYGLVTLLHLIRDDIPQHRPTAKFLSIKIIILVLVIQAGILSSLATSGKLKATEFFTPSNIANSIDAILTCAEMVIISAFHLYAFSATEYAANTNASERGFPASATARLTAGAALLRTLNPLDICLDIRHAFQHAFPSNRRQGDGKDSSMEEVPLSDVQPSAFLMNQTPASTEHLLQQEQTVEGRRA